MLAIDTNVCIYALDGTFELSGSAQELLLELEQSDLDAVASEITIAELLSHKSIKTKSQEQSVIGWFDKLGLQTRSVSKEVLVTAARLRREHGMKLPDAVHVASALVAGATHMVTNDKNLLKKQVSDISIVPLDCWRDAVAK